MGSIGCVQLSAGGGLRVDRGVACVALCCAARCLCFLKGLSPLPFHQPWALAEGRLQCDGLLPAPLTEQSQSLRAVPERWRCSPFLCSPPPAGRCMAAFPQPVLWGPAQAALPASRKEPVPVLIISPDNEALLRALIACAICNGCGLLHPPASAGDQTLHHWVISPQQQRGAPMAVPA